MPLCLGKEKFTIISLQFWLVLLKTIFPQFMGTLKFWPSLCVNSYILTIKCPHRAGLMTEEQVKSQVLKQLLFLVVIVLSLQGSAQNMIFPDTVSACHADSLLLDAGFGFDTYTWSTGETAQKIWATVSGDYDLTVTQGDTVTIFDEFYVILIAAGIEEQEVTISCSDTVQLSGTSQLFSYLWTPGGSVNDSILVSPRDTTVYYARVADPIISYHYCIDSARVNVNPLIVVDTTQQTGIGCPGENKAKIKLDVTGGFPPYEYEWPPEAIPLFEDPSFAIGLTDGDKTVVITDSIGCVLNHNFNVKAHRLPEMDLFSDPTDTVFLQNPYVTFSYENPMYDSLGVDTFALAWWEWEFGDSARSLALSPTHVYQTDGSYTVKLNFKTFYECLGTDTLSMLVRPVDLLIPAVITPNGDFLNDVFEIWEGSGGSDEEEKSAYASVLSMDPIDLNKYYLSNTLIIFNKWGEKVFEVDNYENDWDGGGLSDGMYYYILQCVGEHENKTYKGSLLILTGSTLE